MATGNSVLNCTNSHLANTRDLCAFVIVSDKSLGSGLRRISAVTGADAERVVQKGNDLRERISKLNHSNDSFDRDSASIEKELKSSIVPLLYRGELYGSLKHLKKEAQSLRKKLRRRKAATIGNDNNNGNDDTRRNA
ncbi:unnamed protein product [Anisakis simplex]|uniref:tRNA_SAD domain-containing protein n=1 Tax=Anisakis simplex TaxID=6269 RepID=A0A0M3J8I9_ANISI|nr:unnamed protein product [Anisakis simplex]